jgi:hypothetical protein
MGRLCLELRHLRLHFLLLGPVMGPTVGPQVSKEFGTVLENLAKKSESI